MVAFIDAHREAYGVEPICAVVPIAPSTYYDAKARQADPTRLPARNKRDGHRRNEITRVWCAHGGALMRVEGLRGVVRGARVRTTISDAAAAGPRDLVERAFVASRPNQLWVADVT